ncbi:MAG: peptidylprolyl isomerase [Campylobacterales bacterium]|nr:peptidylprolyl isomerase [Campylobacterales bacterium]
MKKSIVFLIVVIFSLGYAQEQNQTVGTTESNVTAEANATQKAEQTIVVLETNQGTIEVKMFPKVAPLAVENFTTHVQNGYYNGLIFHRVIKNFMIQGGDPTGTGTGGESIWNKEFVNEYAPNVIFDRPFLLAMANHGPNTNGSQFFITTQVTPWLNGGYTIFGEVVSGQDTVTKIENTQTGMADRPVSEQKILKAYIKK